MNYYNEWEPYAAKWLGNLVSAGHLPTGDVDSRDILTVYPEEREKYPQAHFFAGIGGWPLALKLAGWPEDMPVWTGSCPCQPFSICGKKKGEKDERHLWPTFRGLIEKCRPPVVFGEQVASPDGRKWLAGVRADLEDLGYRFGTSDLCAAGVAAPHIRQRLYWVADLHQEGRRVVGSTHNEGGKVASRDDADGRRAPDRLGVAGGEGLEERSGREDGRRAVRDEGQAAGARGPWGDFYLVRCRDGKTRRVGSGIRPLAHGVPARMGKLRAYGNAIVPEVAERFIRAYLEACRLEQSY